MWTGSLDRDGYGQVKVLNRTVTVHRAVYEWMVGPVLSGTLDHLCRVRSCCNPAHLEDVSVRENTLRGYGKGGNNARKTHCKRGHDLSDPDNLVPSKQGKRICRACMRVHWLKAARKARGQEPVQNDL